MCLPEPEKLEREMTSEREPMVDSSEAEAKGGGDRGGESDGKWCRSSIRHVAHRSGTEGRVATGTASSRMAASTTAATTAAAATQAPVYTHEWRWSLSEDRSTNTQCEAISPMGFVTRHMRGDSADRQRSVAFVQPHGQFALEHIRDRGGSRRHGDRNGRGMLVGIIVVIIVVLLLFFWWHRECVLGAVFWVVVLTTRLAAAAEARLQLDHSSVEQDGELRIREDHHGVEARPD